MASLGDLLRQLRTRRRLTQAQLARLVGRSERWIALLESGEVDNPRARDVVRLAGALGVKADALLLQGGVSDESTPILEPEGETKRREFLTLFGAIGAGLLDVERLAAPAVDSAWLQGAETISLTLAGQRSRLPPASLLPAVLGHLNSLEARLPATAGLTARTALLSGSLLIKVGRLADAYRCYSLAEALGDPVIRAKALTGRASAHARRGDTARALALQGEAVAAVAGAPPRGRAGVLARMAELRAEMGDDLGAMRDLDAAERTIASEGYEWFYLSPEHTHELGAYRGSVLALLGRHREAIEAYEWTLARMGPDLLDWRARIAADRDAALAQLG